MILIDRNFLHLHVSVLATTVLHLIFFFMYVSEYIILCVNYTLCFVLDKAVSFILLQPVGGI